MVVVVLLAGTLVQDLQAQSNRMKNQLGIHIGFLGDPFPTLLGGNVNYNIADMLRVSAGYGRYPTWIFGDLTVSTLGAGIRVMVPDWNLSPVVGFSVASVTVISESGVFRDFFGYTGGTWDHVYLTLGFDWQTRGGFNLGAGYNHSLKVGAGRPYVNLGWYFAI